MKNYTFHWEIKSVLMQFSDALNNIIIKRYNESRESEQQLSVNFVYAPKNRVLHDIVNKSQHTQLPVISISPNSIRRNPNRVFNNIDGSYFCDTRTKTPSAWLYLLQPVPVDIGVSVNIIARFQNDIDQILCNFIPYCDPYFVVSWKWPDVLPFGEFEIRSIVKWGEDVSFSHPIDIGANVPYRIIATTSFTIESWMFKNLPDQGKPIYVIDHSFTSVSAIDDFNIMKEWESPDNTDYNSSYTVISARPQITQMIPYVSYTGDMRDFTIYGKMLDYTDRLFLSANNWDMIDTNVVTGLSGVCFYDILSSARLSATFPGFSGIEIPNEYWNIENKATIQLNLQFSKAGIFDIIMYNSAGYGIMTKDCVLPTLNPYPIGSIDYSSYSEFQYNCVSGILIKSI